MTAMLVTVDNPTDLRFEDLEELRADLQDIAAELYEEPVDYVHIDRDGRLEGAYFAEHIDGRTHHYASAPVEPRDDDAARWQHLLREQLVMGALAHRALTDDYLRNYGMGGFDLTIR